MITRQILQWTEDKYNNAESNFKGVLTAFAVGFAEGVIDYAVILGGTLLVIGTVIGIKEQTSKILKKR